MIIPPQKFKTNKKTLKFFAITVGTVAAEVALQLVSGIIIGYLAGSFICFIWDYAKGDPFTESTVTIGMSFIIFCLGIRNLCKYVPI